MEKEEEEFYLNCKAVLIGETFVGKMSIIQRYIKNTFTERVPATGEANFSNKILKFEKENQNIKF